MMSNLKIYMIEFFGTLLLTFVVLGTGNWLAIGAALAVGIYFGGPISGAAYNPAVALALLACKKISTEQIVPYIIFEIAGALVAYWLYSIMKK